MVPPDVLVRDFPILEFHHHHVRELHALARRRDSREQIIPLRVVREADDQFIHHLIFADSYSSMGGPTMPDPNGSTAVDSSSSDKPTSLG